MVSRNFRQAHPQEVGLTQFMGVHAFFNFFFQQDRLQGRFQYRQTPSSNYLKVIEFETCYIKPNPPFFSANKICNGPTTWSIHTMLEGPWLYKTVFPTPMVRPLDESQESSSLQGHRSWLMCEVALRAISHTILRAQDHGASSTLIGWKGGAGPSSLHTTLEGPT